MAISTPFLFKCFLFNVYSNAIGFIELSSILKVFAYPPVMIFNPRFA